MKDNMLKEIGWGILEWIGKFPIRTTFIIFLGIITFALSGFVSGVWQLALNGAYLFITSVIIFWEGPMV